MLAANLTLQSANPDSQPQPTCAQPQSLLPAQVSLPVPSAGGGGSSGGSTGSASGSGSGQSGQTCLQPETPDQPKSEGVTLVGPPADSIYPWTSEFEFSVGNGGKSEAPKAAYLCLWNADRTRAIAAKDRNTAQNVPLDVERDPAHCMKLDAQQTIAKDNDQQTNVAGVPTEQIPVCADGTLKWSAQQYPDKDKTCDAGNPAQLMPQADIQLCVIDDQGQKCTGASMRVNIPFFPRAWVATSREANDSTSRRYVIFGAVDNHFAEQISPENRNFGNNKNYVSQSSVSDPGAVLQQLLATFRRQHEDYAQWTHILLAEMRKADAQALAASLQWHQEHLPLPLLSERLYHFDVVLSAADYGEATPDMDLVVDQWNLHGPYAPQPIRPTPVITPHPIVSEDKMRNPLALLTVQRSSGSSVSYSNYTEDSSYGILLDQKSIFVHACSKYHEIDYRLKIASQHYLENHMPGVEPYVWVDRDTAKRRKLCSSPDNAFQCLALESMQQQLKTDLAFLQKNDFYDSCNYEGPIDSSRTVPAAELVGRVLWNSGYLTRVSVSGSTLRSILQRSETIQKEEQSSTNEPVMRGENLVTLGVSKANGLYFVDGAAVDDAKIYSVATSNKLAFETSKYPELAQVDLALPNVFTSRDDQTYSIAELATVPIASQLAECAACTAQPLQRNQLVALGPSLDKPAKAPEADKATPLENDSATELAVQNRNFLTMTLQQASIGYTNSKPSQTNANIANNLSGVTNPNVASPSSDNLTYSDAFRFLYQLTQHFNLGFDQTITFARNRQGLLTSTIQKTPNGQVVPSESINLSANTFIISPFLEYQPHRYQGGHWKLVTRPITYSTQLAETLQFLPTATTNVDYELRLKRQYNLQPSVGGRYEWNSLNFFEAGYLNQWAHNVLNSLNIDGTPTPITAGQTPVTIASTLTPAPGSTLIPLYGTFHQQGGYWLGLLTKKLTGNAKRVTITYQGITYGNFFAYGAMDRTSTALTRYAAELSNNLQIQLWGNISVGPSYNIFWFQDQSHAPGDNLTRRDWNLQLNYLFDWHQGLQWKYALAGKTSQ